MLEDLKIKDLRYVMLRVRTLKAWAPGLEFQLAMALGHTFNLSVPQLPKLQHGDIYSTRLIGCWEE